MLSRLILARTIYFDSLIYSLFVPDRGICVLKLENISAAYGYLQVVWDVSFEVEKGMIVAILGLNGAGKTTTLKTIAGIIRPKSGRVFFDEKDITGVRTSELVKQGLVFIPEERNLFTGMTVYDNLILGAYTINDRAEVKKTLQYVYSLFPRLKERRKQLVGTMSGGERQMVAVARGLMSNPKLVMLDEPSMGLSPQNVMIVFESIKKLRDEGVTVIIVEQNVNTTLKIADYAYIMDHGRLVLSGSSEQLLADDNVQKMYLGLNYD
jgi:branched-chain amino acid transport system ATP-binding protein